MTVPTKDNGFTYFIVALVVLPVLFIVFLNSSSPSRKTATNDTDDAIFMSQKFVRDSLKSPTTAQFPRSNSEYEVRSIGSQSWRVSSYVDAQNGFGAMLRSYWTAEVHANGHDWKGRVSFDK